MTDSSLHASAATAAAVTWTGSAWSSAAPAMIPLSVLARRGHLAPLAPVERVPARVRSRATPLFEEEGDARPRALVPDTARPPRGHRAEPGPALAADDHPLDVGQREVGDRAEQRLDREEVDDGARRRQLPDAVEARRVAILHARAEPDVRRVDEVRREDPRDSVGALREQLPVKPRRLTDE